MTRDGTRTISGKDRHSIGFADVIRSKSKRQAGEEAREIKWQFAYVRSGGLLSHYNDCWLMTRRSAVSIISQGRAVGSLSGP